MENNDDEVIEVKAKANRAEQITVALERQGYTLVSKDINKTTDTVDLKFKLPQGNRSNKGA